MGKQDDNPLFSVVQDIFEPIPEAHDELIHLVLSLQTRTLSRILRLFPILIVKDGSCHLPNKIAEILGPLGRKRGLFRGTYMGDVRSQYSHNPTYAKTRRSTRGS
jgi:hypothetical protein